MKKTIYLVLALLVLGGIAYALTQTSLLKGNVAGGEAPLKADSDITNMTQAQLRDMAMKDGVELVTLVALDTDGDKLPDDFEEKLGTSWNLADTDGDGIDDGQELNKTNIYITDPLLADTDGGGVDDGTELKTNRTNPIDPVDDVANVDQVAVDLAIKDLAFNTDTGLVQAYVCVTGMVDSAWGDISLNVDATNSTGTSYLTNKEYTVSTADLVSDSCATVDTGAIVDTTLITEGAMDIFLKIDSKSQITEIDERNNEYKELVETGVTPGQQEPVPAEEVDLTIQDLDYTAATGLIRAYVCVEGTVDVAWADVSLYVDAIDSNGDMYLTGTDNEHSVSAADLVSDGCVTLSTGATVDTAIIDEVAMDIILNIDYKSEITETNEQNNSYTERVETGAAQPTDSDVDLTIQDLDYTSSTGAIRAYVCVEGTVDAAWGDVSLSVSATNSTGDEYLTSNDYTVAATDLTSDGCVTVDTGATVDTTLITEASMGITLYIDYKSEITETNEQNNTYHEEVKPVVQTEITSTYACTEVNIDPDAYTYTVDDGTETVDLDITVKVEEKTVSFWNKLGHYLSFLTWGTDWLKASSFIAALDKETTYYSGTLVVEVEASGQGTLTDDKGISGTTLEIPVFWTSEDIVLEHTVTYSNGNSGDIITAYIKKEVDCKDELTLAAPAEEGTYACTDLDISPDSWDVTTDGTSMELEVKSTSNGEDWKGNLVITTDGTGTLSNYEGGSGSSLEFDTGGLDYITYLTYSGAEAGQTITASIEGEEQSCTDTLVISETTTTTTTTTTDDTDDDTTTTTTTTTTTDDTDDDAVDENSDLDEILVSSAKEINCEEPFTDVDEGDWEWAYVVLMNCGDIVSGRDSDSFVPDGNITKAEVIKVLMLLSGHEKTDGDNLDLDFQDANIENHWSRDYLAIAQEERVIRPEEGALFYPDAYANRGQVMLWMARAAGWTLWGWDEDDIFCPDLTKESPYAYAVIIGNLTVVKETWAGETWDEGYVRDSWTESYSDEYTPLFEGDNGYCRATDYLARSEAMALALRFYLALQTDLQ